MKFAMPFLTSILGFAPLLNQIYRTFGVSGSALKMLEVSRERFSAEQTILQDPKKSTEDKAGDLAVYRKTVDAARTKEGKFRLPPAGFSQEGALELFTLTGDYVPEEKESKEAEK
jgi:hypothetical protein